MLRITGGRVYDPKNGVDGVVRDVCVADGKIVEDGPPSQVLDAPQTERTQQFLRNVLG